jgi:hypothetical protein
LSGLFVVMARTYLANKGQERIKRKFTLLPEFGWNYLFPQVQLFQRMDV